MARIFDAWDAGSRELGLVTIDELPRLKTDSDTLEAVATFEPEADTALPTALAALPAGGSEVGTSAGPATTVESLGCSGAFFLLLLLLPPLFAEA